MSEKMSSCPLPFRRKWRERCATPVLKVAVATWTLKIEKQLRVKKSQVQFCSTVSSPNCPIPLALYFLVDGVDLVGNWSVRQEVIVIWLCFLIQLSMELPVSSRAVQLCHSWMQCGQLITAWALQTAASGETLCSFTLCVLLAQQPLPTLDDSIASTTGW